MFAFGAYAGVCPGVTFREQPDEFPLSDLSFIGEADIRQQHGVLVDPTYLPNAIVALQLDVARVVVGAPSVCTLWREVEVLAELEVNGVRIHGSLVVLLRFEPYVGRPRTANPRSRGLRIRQ